MEELHRSKCINHAEREAVARCPACRHYFCRECITEHDGRVICAACLKLQTVDDDSASGSGGLRSALGRSLVALKFVAGLFLLWIVFYAIGQMLLAIPDEFHSGELWSDF